MPERVKGVQPKATTPAEVRSPARRGPGAAAEGSAAATVEMPAAAATGAERVKLFRYLQRTQGNAQVAQMVARLRPPAIRPAVALQRQATACPAPPKEPVSTPPDQDPKFTAVESKIKQQSKDLKKHPTAKSKAKEAQAAAEPPSNDRESQAKAAQAEEMGTAQPAPFDKKAFIEAVRKAIDAASPKTLDEADQFASSGKAGQVKNQVMDKVAKGKEDSAKDVKAKSEQAPDPSKATPKPVTPMAEEKPGAAPADPGAAKAMPGPAPAEQTNLECGACETNAKMAEAGVTEEHLKKSNEPQMQQAVEAKKAGEEHSARAPAEVRSQEQQQLESARQGATNETTSSLNTMHQQRRGILGRVGGDKSSTKARDEAKRAEVSTHIEGIYNTTKREVDGILNGLDDKVSSAFTTGESRARRMFEDNHKTEMARWKDRRYSGVDGAMRWLADKFSPPGDEEAKIFREARNLYLQEMDTVISDVADVVGQELTKAKKRIQQGRDEIRKYVGTLSPELRKVGEEAQQAIASKFDDLDQDVNSKQDSLVNDLAQKYVEARKSVDDKIKQMQEENKGLWDMATEAVGEALEAIEKLKDLFMTTLARAANAFTKILEDPVAFIGNFMNAVKSGFMAFASNILEHLKKGLLGWLFGALASAGIEIPSSFDLKGILKMVASILGLTWGAIKARLVRLIPWLGPVIDFVEDKIEVVAAFVKDGLAGVWNWIKERLTDLKEMILTPIKEFVVESIVKAGITWIIGLLNPAGALAKVIQALIGVVQWVMERGAALGQLIRAVVDAVHDIAHGGMGGVPAKIESALGNAVPLVISFLANLLGLGGISDKIKQIIQAVQRPIGQAIDFVIGGAIKAGKKLFTAIKGRFGRARGQLEEQPESPESKAVKEKAHRQVAEQMRTPFKTTADMQTVVQSILTTLRPEGLRSLSANENRTRPGTYDIVAVASPPESVGTASVSEVDVEAVKAAIASAGAEKGRADAKHAAEGGERGQVWASGGGRLLPQGAGEAPESGEVATEMTPYIAAKMAMFTELGEHHDVTAMTTLTPEAEAEIRRLRARQARLKTDAGKENVEREIQKLLRRVGSYLHGAEYEGRTKEQREAHSQETGEWLPKRSARDQGIPGYADVVHAEKNIYRITGAQAIGVSTLPQCHQCVLWFKERAMSDKKFIVVASDSVRIFMPNGEIKDPSAFT
jgi:hypothetical protein